MHFLGQLFPLLLLLTPGRAEESCEGSSSPTSSPSSSSSSSSSLDLVRVLETLGVAKECKAERKECRNATVVAPLLEASFKKFNIGCRQEAACLVGLMMLESVNATFMRNQSPGRPGQGTVNMQMCGFNLKWAKDLEPGTFSDVDSLECFDKGCKDAGKCNQVLDEVLKTDEGNFFSPAWFYHTQCNETEIKTGLRDNVSFCSDYVTKCVGTDGKNEDRLKRNQQAFEAFDVIGKTKCVPL
ncbi:hypothetical protein L249_1713 [Ophiocordyceps polyrhachis-furcata BCC 54312]|uniref:Uncharacterized protein n=1 Tax=Ophiocordyceps polyrhachis-furcata BCC 54312 TaxID=1330021 RepID=A0A367LQT0_9HYPO|nr:hypothetical protein L249_1713 [Ophiocordyceps polyrhachis-furcata BCC 54312]